MEAERVAVAGEELVLAGTGPRDRQPQRWIPLLSGIAEAAARSRWAQARLENESDRMVFLQRLDRLRRWPGYDATTWAFR